MKITKLKAFTIIELTVVLLITSIVISIAYTSFGILYKQYLTFKSNSEDINNTSLLDRLLSQDFLKSDFVLRKEEGLLCVYRDKSIIYTLNESYILRQEHEVKDTFFVKPVEVKFSMMKNDVNEENVIIDEFSFESTYKEELQYFKFNKIYGADVLMEFEDRGAENL